MFKIHNGKASTLKKFYIFFKLCKWEIKYLKNVFKNVFRVYNGKASTFRKFFKFLKMQIENASTLIFAIFIFVLNLNVLAFSISTESLFDINQSLIFFNSPFIVTKLFILFLCSWKRSLRYSRKSSSPRMKPCGTAHVILFLWTLLLVLSLN